MAPESVDFMNVKMKPLYPYKFMKKFPCPDCEAEIDHEINRMSL